MKKILVCLMLIYLLSSCGFKGFPTPIFPASQDQIEKEVLKRSQEQNSTGN